MTPGITQDVEIAPTLTVLQVKLSDEIERNVDLSGGYAAATLVYQKDVPKFVVKQGGHDACFMAKPQHCRGSGG